MFFNYFTEIAMFNKLICGCVPKGSSCPFSGECNLPCPVNGKVHDRDFSCAMARALEMCDRIKDKQGNRNCL